MPAHRPGSPLLLLRGRQQAAPATVTIRNVELVRAGTWDASTGRVTITPADLDDIVSAGADTEVDHGPVKIGHTGAWATLGDSAPALGWLDNLRRVGNSVVGDLIDVPARLAAIMPKAFRRRSVELLGGPNGPVTTPSGRSYRMVLAGLALLGVQAPAVKGLADLLALYDAPERPIAAGDKLSGTIELDIIEGLDDPELSGVIAAASAALAGSVTSGEATPEAATAILDRIFATAGVAEATIPPPATTPGHTSTDDPNGTTGGNMPVDEARLRELLGIEADADVEATITDLRTRADAQAAAGAGGNGNNGGGNGDQGAGNSTTTTTPPVTPAAPVPAPIAERIAAAGATVAEDGTVRLSAGSFAELLDGVGIGLSAAATLAQQERDRALDDAIRAGRITPDERAHFAAQFADAAPATLATFLGGLAQRFPTVELGGGNASTDFSDEAFDSFMADTFGSELTGQEA
jgi:hypothetical protein